MILCFQYIVTMDEDDATIGIGLGCNGIIKILIEPIDYEIINHPNYR